MEVSRPNPAELLDVDLTDERAVINALADAAARAQRLAEQGPDMYS